ncbi:putative aldouronate transport system substrate-binding protein [Paenibacillus mucilaginosus]|uniref:extracellular solute-binding protein n=1 Tax=Paenibacillus mucilaginosus TaxID=61624 RepID=UPI003D1A4C70
MGSPNQPRAGKAALAVLLTAALLTACSGTGEPGSGGDTAPASVLKDGRFDPPVTMTSWGCYSATYKYKENQSFEKNVGLDWVKEKLGIQIQYLWTTPWENDACLTKMRLSLSGNEPLPDVVYVSVDAKGRSILADLIETGQFMDIGEVFEKHASPAYKEILKAHRELWAFAARDGKRYGIPHTADPYVNSPVLYLRKDWLKTLNLKTPGTIDELEAVMDAFVNKDPDGNGKKDTYGLALGVKNNWLEGFASTGWIFGAYGTVPTYWLKGADGSLQYGSVQPGAKEALAKLRSWYEKGYLDPEFAMKDPAKASELVTAGRTGVIDGPYWLPIWPLPDLKKNVPGSSMLPVMLPAGPGGKPGFNGGDSLLGVYLINKKYKTPEALQVYLNKMLQAGGKEKGSDVENGFIEGYDYKMENGAPVAVPDQRVDQILLGNGTPMIPERNVNSLAHLASGAAPRDGFDQGNVAYKDAHVPGSIMQKQLSFGIQNEFKGASTPTMSTKMEALRKMENEVFTKIIYGKEPLTAFDDFVAKWKSSGGDQITKEVNDWYQAAGSK